jgi:hypothetical protein
MNRDAARKLSNLQEPTLTIVCEPRGRRGATTSQSSLNSTARTLVGDDPAALFR